MLKTGNPLKEKSSQSREFQFHSKQKPFDVASSLPSLFQIFNFSDSDAACNVYRGKKDYDN